MKTILVIEDNLEIRENTAELCELAFIVQRTLNPDFQKEHYEAMKVRHGKHKVLWIDFPKVSAEMLSRQTDAVTILPYSVSLVESFPGEVSAIVVNSTELLALKSADSRVLNLTGRITSLIENVIKTFEIDSTATPDLVTSWG